MTEKGEELMVKCKACGYVGEYTGRTCPRCSVRIVYTAQEAEAELALARSSVKKREYETAVEIYSMLADLGVTEAEREYAEILERGAFVPRDLDEAMRLFLKAACGI